MNPSKSVLRTALGLALAAATAWAAGPRSVLQQQAIHLAYNEGDFEKVVKEIQIFAMANKTWSRQDSIFIAKHLAVVYAANPNTYDKGRREMFRLLELMPTAELVDMFVSDEIEHIFEDVRREHEGRLAPASPRPAAPAAAPLAAVPEQPAAQPVIAASAKAAPPPAAMREDDYLSPPPDPLWKKKVFWIAGGAGLAVAGAVITYVHLQEEGAGTTYVVPGGN